MNQNNGIENMLSFFIGLPIATVLRGYVVVKMWLWFAVPFGVEVIGFWHGLGLSMFISYVCAQYDDGKGGGLKRVIFSLTLSVMALSFGWIYKSLM